MKAIILALAIAFGSQLASAASIEVGAGDYYTYKYTGETYTSLLTCSAEGYQNMFLVGRGIKLDNFYIGAVAGVSLKDNVQKSGLGLTAGLEASFKYEFENHYSIKLESIQTPFMKIDTVLFGLSF